MVPSQWLLSFYKIVTHLLTQLINFQPLTKNIVAKNWSSLYCIETLNFISVKRFSDFFSASFKIIKGHDKILINAIVWYFMPDCLHAEASILLLLFPRPAFLIYLPPLNQENWERLFQSKHLINQRKRRFKKFKDFKTIPDKSHWPRNVQNASMKQIQLPENLCLKTFRSFDIIGALLMDD